jgi:hypothetical protein
VGRGVEAVEGNEVVVSRNSSFSVSVANLCGSLNGFMLHSPSQAT